MKNKITYLGLVITAIILVLSAGCQPASTDNTAAGNKAAANTANQVTNGNSTGSATSNSVANPGPGSLATPTEAYKTAYELRKKKDIDGLRAVMAPDILEFLQMVGDEEKKSLDDMLMEMCEKPQADRAEARNEKISGDIATVEYLTETGEWKTMDFQKIDGQWKLGFPKAGKADDDKKKN